MKNIKNEYFWEFKFHLLGKLTLAWKSVIKIASKDKITERRGKTLSNGFSTLERLKNTPIK